MDLLLTSLRAPLCLPVGWDVPPLTGFLPGTQASMAERRWPTSWTTLVTPIRFMWSPDSRGKRRQSQEDARQKERRSWRVLECCWQPHSDRFSVTDLVIVRS
jgi:hypothetical protein